MDDKEQVKKNVLDVSEEASKEASKSDSSTAEASSSSSSSSSDSSSGVSNDKLVEVVQHVDDHIVDLGKQQRDLFYLGFAFVGVVIGLLLCVWLGRFLSRFLRF
jgi:hypothetical protein